ncbi:lipase 3-like [Achroia grisella]|uniref:lipase 3-like n=1 Tax=Achroia grisella TaxID=688607 RepID=UPI0027D32A9B|nr:lipase 3-like [Achroia grisella]
MQLRIAIRRRKRSKVLVQHCTRTRGRPAPGKTSSNPEDVGKKIGKLFGYLKDYVSCNESIIENLYEEFKKSSDCEDKDLNITQLLKKYGYPVEQHEVTTSDGYILTFFRIPNDGPVAFLMHGTLSSSDDFLTIGSNSGLAYLLADAGYDVWLGNARGNVHSRRHVSLSPSCKEFWAFSWDEIGRYDLPAMIDYILDKTGEEKLIYIGHSQGSTTFFVLCSELPEYNKKISVMVAFSAVAFIFGVPLLDIFSPIVNPLETALIDAIGAYELLPRNRFLQFVSDTLCPTPASATLICGNILFLMAGSDFAQINATAAPVIFGHYPAGSATRQGLHYGQLSLSGKFAQYDHGFVKNFKKYGSLTPPEYPLEKITAPVVIFYSLFDRVTPITSVAKIKSKLANVSKVIKVPFLQFSHADYLFARDVKKLLYDTVLDILPEYVDNKC